MNDLAIARALHLLAIVLSIGGVGFVTTVMSPAIRHFKAPTERVAFFYAIEREFAWQARATTLLAGLTGFYMTERADFWSRFWMPAYWSGVRLAEKELSRLSLCFSLRKYSNLGSMRPVAQ
jgi:uncharacterized membrane protein